MSHADEVPKGRVGRLWGRLRETVGEVDAIRQQLSRRRAAGPEGELVGLRQRAMDALEALMALERERRARRLAERVGPIQGRGRLSTLLDTLAREGGFSAVLLCDDVGLTIATSTDASEAEVLAGLSSLVLTLADRITKVEGASPLAVVVRSDADQWVLHRIFSAAQERFLLTAVSVGAEVPTTALDPVLPALSEALSQGSNQ